MLLSHRHLPSPKLWLYSIMPSVTFPVIRHHGPLPALPPPPLHHPSLHLHIVQATLCSPTYVSDSQLIDIVTYLLDLEPIRDGVESLILANPFLIERARTLRAVIISDVRDIQDRIPPLHEQFPFPSPFIQAPPPLPPLEPSRPPRPALRPAWRASSMFPSPLAPRTPRFHACTPQRPPVPTSLSPSISPPRRRWSTRPTVPTSCMSPSRHSSRYLHRHCLRHLPRPPSDHQAPRLLPTGKPRKRRRPPPRPLSLLRPPILPPLPLHLPPYPLLQPCPPAPAPTNPDPAPQPQRREELRQPVQRSGLRWADTLLPHNGPRPWGNPRTAPKPRINEIINVLVSRLPTGHDTCRQYRLPDPVPLHLRPATTALKDHLLASSFPVRDVHWGTSGRVLSVVPTSTLSAADVHRLDDRVRTLLAQPGITSTPYLYKSQLSVPNLQSYECLPGGDTRPIDPRAFLLTAARRSPIPAWHALDPSTVLAARWGNPHSTSTTLFIDLLDTPLFATLRSLHGSSLEFGNFSGIRQVHACPVSSPALQCANCLVYGHPASTCRRPPCCAVCSGPHRSCDHTAAAPEASTSCVNCQGHHPATDPACPARKAALKARNDPSVSATQARQRGLPYHCRQCQTSHVAGKHVPREGRFCRSCNVAHPEGQHVRPPQPFCRACGTPHPFGQHVRAVPMCPPPTGSSGRAQPDADGFIAVPNPRQPYYGALKPIPAPGGKTNNTGPGDRTADHHYFGTTADSTNWNLLEPPVKGENRPHPRVVCYVNRRLGCKRAFLHPALIHRDAMLLGLDLGPHHTVFILNIYNDARSNSTLLADLHGLLHALPATVHLVGGDFNLHSPNRDPLGVRRLPVPTRHLDSLMGAWGLRLLSHRTSPPTFPHNRALRRVWVRPPGAKHLLKRLEVAQNVALRWVSGQFRSCAIGALQSMTGIPPVSIYCHKLQQSYRLRIHTLLASHPIRSLFPALYAPAAHSPHTPFYPPPTSPRASLYHSAVASLDSLHHLPDITEYDRRLRSNLPTPGYLRPRVHTSYDPLHPLCQPGNRVIDRFGDRLTFFLDHPKKKDADAIELWIRTSLTPRIANANADPASLVLFTDGSAYPDGSSCASGFIAYYPDTTVLHSAAETRGHGFAPDAELYAATDAAAYALTPLLPTVTRLALFMDAEAHTVEIHYCPSHAGVPQNEAVDSLVSGALRDRDGSGRHHDFSSFAYIRRSLGLDAQRRWDALTKVPKPDDPESGQVVPNPAYWGHDYLQSLDTRRHHPTDSRSIIRRFGDLSITTFSRLMRVITGHAPIGAYRAKFRPRAAQPTACPCSYHPRGPLQDRHHILFECPCYYRGLLRPAHLDNLDPFPIILSFLHLNPSAFTFDDGPPDTTDWDADDLPPLLSNSLHRVADLARCHSSVASQLRFPGWPIPDRERAADRFLLHAHQRPLPLDVLPLIPLGHEVGLHSQVNRHSLAYRARGHVYPLFEYSFHDDRATLRPVRHSITHYPHAPPNGRLSPSPTPSVVSSSPSLHEATLGAEEAGT
ncbi:transporter [Ganoderma sinense ZZ0214-1]|uniref:Transporter n=1 Tax=Ganoderma sinense ZZ0214-1 TaxID=1077348 RepID=A0A2G8S8I7_9APHY|nr:transporter [Ganoderma sinense ZZ0214-1]PIL30191.1 transporter [Ganoderma sinense ZZ0214-1]